MFIGTYYHSLEEKGRIAVPKTFREELSTGSVITYGLDGCLFMLPSASWVKLTEKLADLPLANKSARDFLRLLTYHAAPVEYDEQGRIRLPDNLQALAGLSKEVVFAGALTRVEVWDKARYHSYVDSLTGSQGEMESALKELGI